MSITNERGERVLRRANKRPPAGQWLHLPDQVEAARDLAVLALALDGWSDSEIGRELGISPGQVADAFDRARAFAREYREDSAQHWRFPPEMDSAFAIPSRPPRPKGRLQRNGDLDRLAFTMTGGANRHDLFSGVYTARDVAAIFRVSERTAYARLARQAGR